MSPAQSVDSPGRAPVPEWEEAARAAWPGHVPSGIAAFAGRHHLSVLVLSLVVLTLAAWLRLPWLGLAAWLIGSGWEWLSTAADPVGVRSLEQVGLRPQLRALLRSLIAVGLVAGLATATAPNAALTYLTAVLVIQLVWLIQPVLATWLWRVAPPLRYQPAGRQSGAFAEHARVYARGVGTSGVFVALEAAVLLVALITTGRPADSLWVLFDYCFAVAIVETALIYLGWTTWQTMQLRRQAPQTAQELVDELGTLTPRFLVYVSLPARQSEYVVNQWLPALDRLTTDGLILVREASQLAPLEATRHPVIYAPASRDVERLELPSLKAAFYLAYGERNGQPMRNPALRHIFLMHGDSDKATSASNLAKGADEVWVAGSAAIERFRVAGVDLPDERFAVIGRPQVADLTFGPTGNERPVVLYAPTFEGLDDQIAYSSLEVIGPDLVRALLKNHPELRVWFRPHPASGVNRPQLRAAIAEIETMLRAGDGHLVTADQGLSLTECLNAADLLITDISSVATDFLATGRPIVTCDPLGRPQAEFVATYPTTAGSYLVHPGVREVDLVLGLAFGDDPLRPVRDRLRREVLGELPDGPQAAFEANVRRVTSG
ncbi:CDP-glycerol:poly(glycerophosphate) glycerophosphotransferase [Propionicimonas paludicola]|uniref:CDP-glycerol:poly(Glycerophosphate) glycerophosphotransferase n=1 Tax=Propionicimonas paludicola TaxID=185243 RepID=A0A2A9CUX4_9ACTN|nr:CDP-glycerol glycerophosphotransferase family protein [Propionicimonas paludicola]PFG17845.1 CDP-glycerol:poly(glycerophosphate) glycerophosphotransferase [Propionicimonas paludicola]